MILNGKAIKLQINKELQNVFIYLFIIFKDINTFYSERKHSIDQKWLTTITVLHICFQHW